MSEKICTFCNAKDRLLVKAIQPWNNDREVYVCFVCVHTKVKELVLD